MKLPKIKLFARLFILFGFSTLMLTVLIVLTFVIQSENSFKRIIEKNPYRTYRIITQLVDFPPDLNSMHIAKRDIRGDFLILKDDFRWSTSDTFPTLTQFQASIEPVGEIYLSKHQKRYYLLARHKGYWIVARSLYLDVLVYPNWASSWPLILCFVVITSCYFLLKHWLKPIQDVIQCVTQVRKGDFENRITHHPGNELAELTHSINGMARDLTVLFNAKRSHLLSVSHELKSPLAKARISLASLIESAAKNEILQDLQQMENTINQLLEIERLSIHGAIKKGRYWLPSLIQEILKLLVFSERIVLKSAIPEVVVELDKARFYMLLRNLLDNAIKYSEISPVDLSFKQYTKTLELRVQDYGNGIADNEVDEIFNPFYRSQRHNASDIVGKGLGLYLCKCVVLAHNGVIDVTSRQGCGSCFTAQLNVIV